MRGNAGVAGRGRTDRPRRVSVQDRRDLGIVVPGHEGSLAYVAGAPVLDNAHRFAVYTLLTSTGGWDTGRAITTCVAVLVLGPAILTTLRRAARRAVVAPGTVMTADRTLRG